MLHSRILGEQTQLKEELETLRRDNSQLVREQNHLQQNCEELQRLHTQDQKELVDLRQQQQQVRHPDTRRNHTLQSAKTAATPHIVWFYRWIPPSALDAKKKIFRGREETQLQLLQSRSGLQLNTCIRSHQGRCIWCIKVWLWDQLS